MAIDKQTAGILYSYGYKLQDSEGNVYDVVGARQNWIHLNKNGFGDWRIKLTEIGTTYKILARPLEQLTQEIDGKVPIVELAKIESRTMQNADKYTYGFEAFKRGLSFDSHTPCVRWYQYHFNKLEDHTDSTHFEMQLYSLSPLRFIKKTTYKPNYIGNPWYSNSIFNHDLILDFLKSMHFNIGFPENTTTDLI